MKIPELRLHNRNIESIFSLLGEKENDITYSLGWAFSRSPHFLQLFLKKILPPNLYFNIEELEIVLQEHKGEAGITDIEIREISGTNVHVIIEAKRGWSFPSLDQLEKYVPRFRNTNRDLYLIVTMSECSEEYARASGLPTKVNGIAVKHISWSEISSLCNSGVGSHAEKRLMRELKNYLATIVNMQKQDSNWVYVVSLGNQECAPGLTFKQVVNERKRYFHPYGSGERWPKEPPNYIGFRYDGILQSIHHIESAELFKNFHLHFPEYPDEIEDGARYLYKLGPAIRPLHEVKAGAIVRSLRVWAMLDLLLTCQTISEARDKSYKRLEQI
ncbi:MAG TPA: hypothetical protein VE344_07415 [Methylomirabilota bacterium]|nr:hypothetical protein [Methylomirabilota bacterium]